MSSIGEALRKGTKTNQQPGVVSTPPDSRGADVSTSGDHRAAKINSPLIPRPDGSSRFMVDGVINGINWAWNHRRGFALVGLGTAAMTIAACDEAPGIISTIESNAQTPQPTTDTRPATPTATASVGTENAYIKLQTPEQQQQAIISTVDAIISKAALKDPKWQSYTTTQVRIDNGQYGPTEPIEKPGEVITNGVPVIPGGFVGAFVSNDGTLYYVMEVEPKDASSTNPNKFFDKPEFLLFKVDKATIKTIDGTYIINDQYMLNQTTSTNDMTGSGGLNPLPAIKGIDILGQDKNANADSSNPQMVASALNEHLVGTWTGFAAFGQTGNTSALNYLEHGGTKPDTVLTADELKQEMAGLVDGKMTSTNAPVAGTVTHNFNYNSINP